MIDLSDKKDLEISLKNLTTLLLPKGKIIIDLHNPQSSGEKTDTYNNIKRTMKWQYNQVTKIEETEIIFEIDSKIYKDSHRFRIFTIAEIEEVCNRVGLNLEMVFANYDINQNGNSQSKNLQFLITKY